MAKLPDKNTLPPARDDRASPPKRRSPLTDFLDASEPLHKGGFAEAPQAEFSGTPLTGSIADWAEQIEQEAEKEAWWAETIRRCDEAEKHPERMLDADTFFKKVREEIGRRKQAARSR